MRHLLYQWWMPSLWASPPRDFNDSIKMKGILKWCCLLKNREYKREQCSSYILCLYERKLFISNGFNHMLRRNSASKYSRDIERLTSWNFIHSRKEENKKEEKNVKCKTFNYPVTNQRALVTQDAFLGVIKATARNNTRSKTTARNHGHHSGQKRSKIEFQSSPYQWYKTTLRGRYVTPVSLSIDHIEPVDNEEFPWYHRLADC